MNDPDELKCFINWAGKLLKHSSLLGPLVSYEENENNHKASFSSQLINGLNKLHCYITLGWKGFQVQTL
jgi:hypothetical protein